MCKHILVDWSKNLKGVEIRRVFWRIAKSTFEAELKDNIETMRKLGQEGLDNLLWYNLSRSILKNIANVILWTTIWQKALMLG